jgi:hypothetical protein
MTTTSAYYPRDLNQGTLGNQTLNAFNNSSNNNNNNYSSRSFYSKTNTIAMVLLGISFVLILVTLLGFVFSASSFTDALQEVKTKLVNSITFLLVQFGNLGDFVLSQFTQFSTLVIAEFNVIAEFLGGRIVALANFLQLQLETNISTVARKIVELTSQIFSLGEQTMFTVGLGFAKIIESVTQAASYIAVQMSSFITMLFSTLESFVSSALSYVFTLIMQVLGDIIDLINDLTPSPMMMKTSPEVITDQKQKNVTLESTIQAVEEALVPIQRELAFMTRAAWY